MTLLIPPFVLPGWSCCFGALLPFFLLVTSQCGHPTLSLSVASICPLDCHHPGAAPSTLIPHHLPPWPMLCHACLQGLARTRFSAIASKISWATLSACFLPTVIPCPILLSYPPDIRERRSSSISDRVTSPD